MTTTLAWKDGYLCVQDVTFDSQDPIRRTRFWPVHRCTESYAKDCYPLGITMRHDHDGRYTYWHNGRTITVHLEAGGQTKSLAIVEEKVEPPTTRCPVRWHYNGHWQKYLKAKGWVTA